MLMAMHGRLNQGLSVWEKCIKCLFNAITFSLTYQERIKLANEQKWFFDRADLHAEHTTAWDIGHWIERRPRRYKIIENRKNSFSILIKHFLLLCLDFIQKAHFYSFFFYVLFLIELRLYFLLSDLPLPLFRCNCIR